MQEGFTHQEYDHLHSFFQPQVWLNENQYVSVSVSAGALGECRSLLQGTVIIAGATLDSVPGEKLKCQLAYLYSMELIKTLV